MLNYFDVIINDIIYTVNLLDFFQALQDRMSDTSFLVEPDKWFIVSTWKATTSLVKIRNINRLNGYNMITSWWLLK